MSGGNGFGQDVEEGAGADGVEQDAAAVFVGFDAVVDACRGQQRFEAKGVFEALGDVDQDGFVTLEKGGVAFHF